MIQYESDESDRNLRCALVKMKSVEQAEGTEGTEGTEGKSWGKVLRLRRWLRPGDLALGRLEVSVWDRFGADVSVLQNVKINQQK